VTKFLSLCGDAPRSVSHENVLSLWAIEFRECSRRIVNAVEKLRRADDFSQEMPVQVCLQRERRASEYQHNSAVDQFLVK